ncbi:Z1 domain-containing protein [Chitinophaga dinghuensis]|uniref:Z1 domain-containing protein n=1 Tax=Chitinophaga dinghuensis TaxID=1539050 RepID=A0A327W2V3_9BACT|nr:Z1 domain-containing protein [Chitinophaga dinghuensis]RAJ83611.1 Z1 domain-containing protein [Chitinophaga dinghuensis]
MKSHEIVYLLKTIIKSKAEDQPAITLEFFEDIRDEVLNMVKVMSSQVKHLDEVTLQTLYNTAKNEFISVYPVEIDPSGSLRREGLRTWLTEDRKKNMPTSYLDRYIESLIRSGRPEKVINEVIKSSESILGKLGDPQSGTDFYCKGLVVGSVQSGKTANFNAVINRAIDSGYPLIIVLSGIMEDLRSQTQERIDYDVIGEGYNKANGRTAAKGVGLINRFGEQGNKDVRQVRSITSVKSDFKKSVKDLDFSLNHRNILICKKNTGVLKNLLIWLSGYLSENQEQHKIPLLLIDDEADNASLNNLGHKGADYASTINGHIRALLKLFSRKTYLGYTATPFANVLQDRHQDPPDKKWPITFKSQGKPITREYEQENNIFPDDFIELLNPPSNYIGAKNIFETVLDDHEKKIPLLEQVEDIDRSFPAQVVNSEEGPIRGATAEEIKNGESRASTRYDPFPFELPKSLHEAIQCFILSIAVRLSRKPEMVNSEMYQPHHTMLVHVSRFIPWQNKTKKLISEYVQLIENRIKNELPKGENSIYRELEVIWNKYFAAILFDIRSYLPVGYQDEFLTHRNYNDIEPLLIEAIKGIEIKAVNSETKDKLDYIKDAAGNGKKYIAIGGNRLSRGFTLEGLTINYFVRNTNFSDTLLQMGRWFGYRPGYIDCCKLFTTADAIEKYDIATRTIEELEVEFSKMERAGKFPKDFILRVRKDPGVLKITRPSILKNADTVVWSYQNKLVQPTKFDLNPDRIKASWTSLKQWVSRSYNGSGITNSFYQFETDYTGLFSFITNPNSLHNYGKDLDQIKKFIQLCADNGKLRKWTIAIKATGNGRQLKHFHTDFPLDITMIQRSGPNSGHLRADFETKNIFSVSGKSANIVTGPEDLSILLSQEQIQAAKKKYDNARIKDLIKGKGMTEEDAQKYIKTHPIRYPEKIYRGEMSDNNGLLLVYLQDLHSVFNLDENNNGDFKNMSSSFDLTIPLIGYAFGFPEIEPDPGGTYAVGKYGITETDINEEEDAEEFDESLNGEEE